MSVFLLAVNTTGQPMTVDLCHDLHRVELYDKAPVKWNTYESSAAMIGLTDRGPLASVVQSDGCVGVGSVRLDNRREVARWSGCDMDGPASDLQLVVGAIARHGDRYIPDLLGDFAFAVWNSTTRQLFAARDAFGVRRLAYRRRGDVVTYASRADLLASDGIYDRQSLVETVVARFPAPDRTVYANVNAVPPGSIVITSGGREVVREYWSADRFISPTTSERGEHEYYDQFRELFARSVQLRLTGQCDVWSQLSGGLDSSSVVSMAQWLAQHGLTQRGVAGTISWVYRWSIESDEREYSTAVVRQWSVRNEVMDAAWFWADDGLEPPLTDEPDVEYPLYARERKTLDLIRASGGRVLLTGLGSDHYLLASMFFFADDIARGHIRRTVQAMIERAAQGNVSFWHLAYENAVLPLLPKVLQHGLIKGTALPSWLDRRITREYEIARTPIAAFYQGRRGQKYGSSLALGVGQIPGALRRNLYFDEWLDVRHPFLYRPLVEFGLGVPHDLCVRPNARKWILRQAMSGVLPEAVRSRVGKGSNDGCLIQSIAHERPRIERLLARPILGELGCIDPRGLHRAFEAACRMGDENVLGPICNALAVETWLRVRSDRRI